METPEKEHWNITVKGRVQGVGFRYSTRSYANSIGIHGFVKNMSNRDVYIEAEGNLHQLQDLVRWCHQGPPHAHVEHVTYIKGSFQSFAGFEIH